MRPLSGTVTFLLTDVEASTQAWQTDSAAAAAAVARQEEIVAAAIEAHGGYRPLEQGEGDSLVAAFGRPSDALAAAVQAQLALSREPWPTALPLRVRMALHTGEADARDGRYAGATIIRAARLRAAAHGGQTVVSRATVEVLGDALPDGAALIDLGTHRLRDLTRAERIFQVVHPELPRVFPPLRSLDLVANNLPAELSSFVGREAELSQVARLLANVRLLTLTGTGGCGKTRLAAHAAARVAEAYPAGVWWVDLASLGPGSAVSTAALSVLGLHEQPSRTAADQLVEQLAEGPALLVMDNCEHVLDAVVQLIEPVLRRRRDLTVMATSREPLRIAGETTWRVPALDVPALACEPTPESLTAYDAVALFVERARQARPNFAVTNENAPAVAEICIRLDGIPLAIELAAARVRVLSPDGIRKALDDRFRLLTGGVKQTVARHQTLAASVDWSYELLTADERMLFRRLSVFAGGFTLDAAEAICAGDGIEALQVLDLLTSLVDKSLVVAGEDRPDMRYGMLETIRQFASTRLRSAGEAELLGERHLALQLRLAKEADAAFWADDVLVARLAADHDNLRAALGWALGRDRLDEAISLVVGLSDLWLSRGLLREALSWFDRVLGHPELAESSLRYRVLWARMVLAIIDGRPDPAFSLAPEAARQARDADDRRYVARALTVHGTAEVMHDPAAGQAILAEAVTLADDVGDTVSSVLARLCLIVAGIHRDDHADVARQLEDAMPVFRNASAQMQSMYHALAGWSDVRIGRFAEARRQCETARTLASRAGDPVLAGALVTLTLALLELAEGRVDEAADILEPARREPRAAGPTREDAMLTGAWGLVLVARGRLDEAEDAMTAAIQLADEIGDGVQYAFCLGWRTGLLRLLGERDEARASAAKLETHARQQGNAAFEALALRELSFLERLDGEIDRADDLAHRALALSAPTGLVPDTAETLAAVAGIAAAEESWDEATRLFAAAHEIRARLGAALTPWAQLTHDEDISLVRAALDRDAFEVAWAEGGKLSIDEAVAYAQRGRGERKRPSAGWASLTPTERQVVELLSQGLRNADIAARLFVAPSTVKTHLAHVFAKLGVSNRAGLAALVARRR